MWANYLVVTIFGCFVLFSWLYWIYDACVNSLIVIFTRIMWSKYHAIWHCPHPLYQTDRFSSYLSNLVSRCTGHIVCPLYTRSILARLNTWKIEILVGWSIIFSYFVFTPFELTKSRKHRLFSRSCDNSKLSIYIPI